ncbi:MAG: Hsp33 family molecular chaperone HslO, partial [Anaerolineales bacterium]|nr:Hsp33 family molecular chaperone HslO [Anaerolineales bacterium]
LVQEASTRHETSPTASAALGRGLTGAALMGALLKVRQRIAIKFEGDGPLRKMLVESDAYGKVRGYVSRPDISLPENPGTADPYDVGRAIGAGLLTVVKDLKLRDLHESLVPIATGQVDEDLELYLNQSEQIPSAVQVGTRLDQHGEVLASGGLLIQNLAGYENTAIHQIAERILDLPPMVDRLAEGQTVEEIAAELFDGLEIGYEVLEKRPLVFLCGCSRERSIKALTTLGTEDIEAMIEEGQAVVDCHFCHERYLFSAEELQEILATMQK